jgi:hypothetical protein
MQPDSSESEGSLSRPRYHTCATGVKVIKLFTQKLVARILSHVGVVASFPNGHPFGALAVTSKIRCDPIDAIGSPPPVASLLSPLKDESYIISMKSLVPLIPSGHHLPCRLCTHIQKNESYISSMIVQRPHRKTIP